MFRKWRLKVRGASAQGASRGPNEKGCEKRRRAHGPHGRVRPWPEPPRFVEGRRAGGGSDDCAGGLRLGLRGHVPQPNHRRQGGAYVGNARRPSWTASPGSLRPAKPWSLPRSRRPTGIWRWTGTAPQPTEEWVVKYLQSIPTRQGDVPAPAPPNDGMGAEDGPSKDRRSFQRTMGTT